MHEARRCCPRRYWLIANVAVFQRLQRHAVKCLAPLSGILSVDEHHRGHAKAFFWMRAFVILHCRAQDNAWRKTHGFVYSRLGRVDMTVASDRTPPPPPSLLFSSLICIFLCVHRSVMLRMPSRLSKSTSPRWAKSTVLTERACRGSRPEKLSPETSWRCLVRCHRFPFGNLVDNCDSDPQEMIPLFIFLQIMCRSCSNHAGILQWE